MPHSSANTFVAAGSLEALRQHLDESTTVNGPLVAVATAAAYSGATKAFENAQIALGRELRLIGAENRTQAMDAATADVVRGAGLVICLDGAVLHARSVWRGSPLGDALLDAPVAAIGAVSSVFGETMIDTRGGAPTTGLGRFSQVALFVPGPEEQTRRTKELLGAACLCIELGPQGVVAYQSTWELLSATDVIATRGEEPVALRLGDRH